MKKKIAVALLGFCGVCSLMSASAQSSGPRPDVPSRSAPYVSGRRIAVLFAQPDTQEQVIKVVDLEGHEVETLYQPVVNGQPKYGGLGLGLVCYTDNPERFTFLSTGDGNKLEFLIAEPR